MSSLVLDAYVLCIHPDGHSQIELNHADTMFIDSASTHDSLHSTEGDCIDRALADTAISLKANNFSETAPYFNFVLVGWTTQPSLRIVIGNRAGKHFIAHRDFATLIKPTTVLVI